MATETSKKFCVVTALIEREGRYLITQRCAPDALVGLWEFPSAKVEPGQGNEVTLERELRERLGIDVKVGRLRASRVQQYDRYSVQVFLFETSILPGQVPEPLTVADFRWVAAEELEQYAFLGADQATTDLLLGIGRERPKGSFPTRHRGVPDSVRQKSGRVPDGRN